MSRFHEAGRGGVLVLLKQGGAYVLTGGGAAVVDLGMFWIGIRLGFLVFPASLLSFCIASVVNFSLSARFVFGAKISLRGFGIFFLFALMGLLINVSVTTMAAYAGAPLLLAKLLGIGVAFLVNFLANALIVFRRTHSAAKDA